METRCLTNQDGKVMDEGYTKHRLQSLPCRAPEVWKGQGVSHASEVWSVGVTVSYESSYS